MKLIRHGLDDRGEDRWGFPVYPWGECPHPRTALRADSRYMPLWFYCRACGEAGLPWHLYLTPEEIEEASRKGAEMAEALGWT